MLDLRREKYVFLPHHRPSFDERITINNLQYLHEINICIWFRRIRDSLIIYNRNIAEQSQTAYEQPHSFQSTRYVIRLKAEKKTSIAMNLHCKQHVFGNCINGICAQSPD